MNVALCSSNLPCSAKSRPSFNSPFSSFASFLTNKSDSIVLENTTTEESSSEPLSLSESQTRRLILLRHAKSSSEDLSLRDHDRPLSKSGRGAAIGISRKLQEMGWIPELILCSDAVRSRETLRIIQEQVRSFLEAEVHFVSSFYSVAAMDGQTAEHIQKIICQFSRVNILTIMCIGHNKGWEEAASMLAGTSIELNSCDAALLQAAGRSWEEAFAKAGLGGWKLSGIASPENYF